MIVDGIPGVGPDVLNREPLRRVWIQNVADQVLCVL